jgi:thymidylate synthase
LITKEFDHKNKSTEDKLKYLETLTMDDISLENYWYWPGIKMKMVA